MRIVLAGGGKSNYMTAPTNCSFQRYPFADCSSPEVHVSPGPKGNRVTSVICRRQAVMHHGGSRTTVIPAKAKVSDVVPVAVGARLMLVDLRGEATPEDLAALLEDLVEPALAGRDRLAAAGERRLRGVAGR